MRRLGLAMLQLELGPDDNVELIAAEVRAVRQRFPWVDLAIFGELAAHGASIQRAEPPDGPLERRFREIAKEHSIWLLPGSYYVRDGEHVHNVTPAIDPGGEVVARHRKLYPFLPYERHVAPGPAHTVFDVPGVGRFGISICYDMWFPETTRALAWLGAEAILHPSLTNTIDRDVEIAIARASAATNQCYFIDVNGAGRLAVGRSCAFGPGGEPLHLAGSGREIIALELDLDQVAAARERGWHGLGQPLKSFRDTPLAFPAYEGGARQGGAFAGLGKLERPAGRLSKG